MTKILPEQSVNNTPTVWTAAKSGPTTLHTCWTTVIQTVPRVRLWFVYNWMKGMTAMHLRLFAEFLFKQCVDYVQYEAWLITTVQPQHAHVLTRTTWRHLLLLPYGVISGELDPLVCLDARHAQKLDTLHAVTCRLRVVVAAHAHLSETKNKKTAWKEEITVWESSIRAL